MGVVLHYSFTLLKDGQKIFESRPIYWSSDSALWHGLVRVKEEFLGKDIQITTRGHPEIKHLGGYGGDEGGDEDDDISA